MRDTLDCAVLMTPDHAVWVQDWVDSHCGQFGRLRLYAKDFHSLSPRTQDASLSPVSLAMRRFDGCILPVAPSSLSWTRTMLANVDMGAGVPLIALLFDISAPAILDLLSLGVTDFVRAPVCPDELRARLLSFQRRVQPTTRTQTAHEIRSMHELSLVEGGPSTRQRALCSESTSFSAPETFDVRSTDEPFRQAKARVVDSFERAYLRRALSRHSGNVAQAARASCKHRRAFWALMRKHQIDASHYRVDEAFLESLS